MSAAAPTDAPPAEQHFLTVKDVTTGATIQIPISVHNTVPAASFAALKIKQTTPLPPDPQQTLLKIYDPVVCKSKISQVSNTGLKYRGYAVDELYENSTFLEVAYLLVNKELPTKAQSDEWTEAIMQHTYLHAELEKQMTTFRYDAHPMGMLIATVASLSTFHPDANPALQGDAMYIKPKNGDVRRSQKVEVTRNRAIFRILGKVPTIAANAHRNRIGRTYNSPMPNCTNYAENFLYMIDKLNEPNYVPNPKIVKILDKMFILLAEHGTNCSTITMRHLASSGVDPYTALSGSFGSLFGERKSTNVLRMLELIGTPDNVPVFLQFVKDRKNIVKKPDGSLHASASGKPTRLQGFGHRIYKHTDPRVVKAKALALELFSLIGRDEIGTLAVLLEEAAKEDPWFDNRHLFPNIDFWTAIVFHTLGFPADMFPVLTAVPRTAGFLAHWVESLEDDELKIYRPRQIYCGEWLRDYTADRLELDEEVELVAETGYVKSLPHAANVRFNLSGGETEEVKLSQLKAMMERTDSSIRELMAHGSSGGAIVSPLLATLMGERIMNRASAAGHASQGTKFASTQRDLLSLRQKQQELLQFYLTNRDSTQDNGSKVPPLKIHITPPASPKRERMSVLQPGQPDLMAGSNSARPILSPDQGERSL
ncbi:hypothetical protein HDU98_008519 [Podochytrium sp. JEL0797]|nr:hypothetical protein HDU98_008519 [Podochytrium sp. JEL0797]